MCEASVSWWKANEHWALWIEGFALVFIFGLDFFEYRRQGAERKKRDRERIEERNNFVEQLKASQEQTETMQRPFVSFSSVTRDPGEAAMQIHGIKGDTEIYCPQSQAQIKNYGAGQAINIRYAATPTNLQSSIARPEGYLVTLSEDGAFLTTIPQGILQGNEWESIFTYESLSGRKYRTRIVSNDLVMTDISFSQLPD
jgi:hypothetical protein